MTDGPRGDGVLRRCLAHHTSPSRPANALSIAVMKALPGPLRRKPAQGWGDVRVDRCLPPLGAKVFPAGHDLERDNASRHRRGRCGWRARHSPSEHTFAIWLEADARRIVNPPRPSSPRIDGVATRRLGCQLGSQAGDLGPSRPTRRAFGRQCIDPRPCSAPHALGWR